MNLHFKAELANLKAAGVQLSDMTADEIAALVRATDKLADPFGEVNADAVGMPVKAAENVVFWRFTIGAAVWYEEYARKWWDGRPEAMFWATVYALRHGREQNAFVNLTREDEAFKAIENEGLQLCVSREELEKAVDKALNFGRERRQKEQQDTESGIDWAAIIARLETQTGLSSEYWCWKHSADYALRAYYDLRYFAEVYAGGRRAKQMTSELDHAANALARLRCSIVERVNKQKEAAENGE